ncbi:MAG: reverse transcriptase family protein [Muribaculaceae bacterium]|nr:reverse transcriptase family protein [Muribaculaceae bacterium]
MEIFDLHYRTMNLTILKEFAELLDEIKQTKFKGVKYQITHKMLRYYSSDYKDSARYKTFHIRKKSGGLREIKSPCPQLEVILTCINEMLKSVYTPSDATMGFTSGKSVLSNAEVHVGHNYVFNIDLENFFPSIPQARVWKRLQLPPFNYPQNIASLIAGLCCCYDSERKTNVLPQGSPTSPLLTNAICDNLDRRMKGVAKRFGLHYSRYADDMTFSSMHNVYQDGSKFREEIKRLITQQGFRMNESKTRLQKIGERQEVTGLIVNSVANVSRKKFMSDLRWIISVWEREGYEKAYALFYRRYKQVKGYIKKGEPVMENVIEGKLNYLRMVRGANYPAYKKLAERFAALNGLVFVDKATDKSRSYVYVQPYKLKDFQSLFNTEIWLEVSRDGKLIGRCKIDKSEKYLSVSKSTQRILCPTLQELTPGDKVTCKKLENCFVTLCRSRGKNFWLITKFEPRRSRCLSIQNAKLDIDQLLDIWEKKGFESAASALQDFLKNGIDSDLSLSLRSTEEGIDSMQMETTENK